MNNKHLLKVILEKVTFLEERAKDHDRQMQEISDILETEKVIDEARCELSSELDDFLKSEEPELYEELPPRAAPFSIEDIDKFTKDIEF